jgi:hypothetical protein
MPRTDAVAPSTMTGPACPPATLGGAILGGALAAGAIVLANQLADRLGLTDLDLLRVLGLTFRPPREAGVKPAGLAWYMLSGGVLVPTLYWLGFRLLGRAGAGVGLLFGLLHYVASGALLGATTPRRPKDPVGEGRPMGAFVSRYGPLEWSANLVGHLLYGAVLGRVARRR